MARVVFKVISESSGQAYELIAEPTGGGLRFTCDCAAGALGQMCKHRQAIIEGDFSAVQAPNAFDSATFKEWLQASRIGALMDSLSAVEDEIKAAKKRIMAIKHELGRRLKDGTA